MDKCKVNKCSSEPNGNRGYCVRHYQQIRLHGKIFNRTCRDKNAITFEKNYVCVKLYDRTNNVVGITKIDKQDYETVKSHKLYKANTGYCLFTKFINGKWKHFSLHRHVVNPPKNKIIDHINFDKLDNRRKNLRVVSSSENAFHRPGRSGVYIDKKCTHKKYFARITVNKKQIYLGHFYTINEATKRRREAELMYFPGVA